MFIFIFIFILKHISIHIGMYTCMSHACMCIYIYIYVFISTFIFIIRCIFIFILFLYLYVNMQTFRQSSETPLPSQNTLAASHFRRAILGPSPGLHKGLGFRVGVGDLFLLGLEEPLPNPPGLEGSWLAR